MNIIFTTILIISFSLLPAQVHATANTYYVTQNGNGTRSGESLGNAWSVSDLNSSANWSTADHSNKIDPGDTIYFSGTITSQIKPQISGNAVAGRLTLDGLQSGDCNPVVDEAPCTSAATISLTEDASSSNYGIYASGQDYLNIQDFNINTVSQGIVVDTGDYIDIKRNYVTDTWQKGINVIDNSTYITIGGASGDGNYLKDCEEHTSGADTHVLGIDNVDDFIISYNSIEPTYIENGISTNNISIHGAHRFIVEYNHLINPWAGSCISVKEWETNTDGIVRFNYCEAHTDIASYGISISFSTEIYVYGNFVKNTKTEGIRAHTGSDNIYFFSNISVGNGLRGFSHYRINPSFDEPGTTYCFNNTIYNNGADATTWSHAGAYIGNIKSGDTLYMKNNIFSKNETYSGAPDQFQIAVLRSTVYGRMDIYNNQFYFTNKDSTENVMRVYPTTYYDIADLGNSNSWGDPGLTDPANGDFSIASGSAVISAGVDMGSGALAHVTVQGTIYAINWDIALDPNNTDWSTSPPTVATANRDDYGDWDMGAYVFKEELETNLIPPPPHSLRFTN